MEIMARPSRETMIFYNEVWPWIVAANTEECITSYAFADDTPEEIINLFNEIKDKLKYKCKIAE